MDLVTFTILAATTIPLARFGVRCAHGFSGRYLQIVFVGLRFLIGLLRLVEG